MNQIDRRYFYTVIKVLFLLLLKSEKRREDISKLSNACVRWAGAGAG